MSIADRGRWNIETVAGARREHERGTGTSVAPGQEALQLAVGHRTSIFGHDETSVVPVRYVNRKGCGKRGEFNVGIEALESIRHL